MNRDTVLKIYSVLSKVKVNKLQQSDALLLIRFMIGIKKVATECQDGITEIRRTCIPDGLEDLEQKFAEKEESINDDEKRDLMLKRKNFYDNFQAATKSYLDDSVEINPISLSENTIMILHDTNDLSLDEASILLEYLS